LKKIKSTKNRVRRNGEEGKCGAVHRKKKIVGAAGGGGREPS